VHTRGDGRVGGERTEWGRANVEHGLVFAREDTSPLPLVCRALSSCV
jgi:hypothetical protein